MRRRSTRNMRYDQESGGGIPRVSAGLGLKTKKIVNPDYLMIQDEVRAEFGRMGFEVIPS